MSKTLKAREVWSDLNKDSLHPETSYYLNVQNINSFDFYFLIKQPLGDLSFGIDYKYWSALPKELLKLKSIKIEDLVISKSKKLLVLTLINSQLKDTFISFVQSLINEITNCQTNRSIKELFIKQIKNFYLLFEKEENPKLSKKLIRGIFAELLFLEKLIIDLKPIDPLDFWKSPKGSLHDFQYKNNHYEIKSHSGTNIINVFNERQLSTLSPKKIFLITYPLFESSNGVSINEKIIQIKKLIKSKDLVEKLYSYLNSLGYYLTHSKYYDNFLLLPDKPNYFLVNENFPSSKLNSIGSEIFNISYQLDLTKCSEWELKKLQYD